MARLASTTLCVGDAAPPFVLTALDGQRVELVELLGQGALLLIFAPGVWSPNVRRQMVELAAAYDRFLAAGIQVAMVLTQDRRRVVERLTYVSPPFAVLTDERRRAARDYGVYRALSLDGVGVTRPAAFLIDAQGVLRFVYAGQDDTDVVDAVTLLRIACWLVGAAEVLEALAAEEAVPEVAVEGLEEQATLAVATVGAPMDGLTSGATEAESRNGDSSHPEDVAAALAQAEPTSTDGGLDGQEAVEAEILNGGETAVAVADSADADPEHHGENGGDGVAEPPDQPSFTVPDDGHAVAVDGVEKTDPTRQPLAKED